MRFLLLIYVNFCLRHQNGLWDQSQFSVPLGNPLYGKNQSLEKFSIRKRSVISIVQPSQNFYNPQDIFQRYLRGVSKISKLHNTCSKIKSGLVQSHLLGTDPMEQLSVITLMQCRKCRRLSSSKSFFQRSFDRDPMFL